MTTLEYDPPASTELVTGDVPPPVQLVAAGPAPQRRWTVAIRWILVIPHIVVLYFLNIAAGVVVFIGWWGALFTGRLPEFAYSYLSGVTRWSTRVQAYGSLLLTDQYPPFSLRDEPAYPVRIAIPPRRKLNRVAVLFRVILAIPASLLNALVTYGGMTIVAIIAWLVTLIDGKLPAYFHLAYTAILRYSARTNGYLFMLTAVYPAGLFGDGLLEPDAAAVPDEAAVPPAGDEAPVDAETPEEAPVDAETPEEAPVDAETPEEAPVDAAAPGQEASVDVEVPAEEVPEEAETPEAETPVAETPVAETPVAETPEDAAPGYEVPDELAVPEPDLAAGQPADWRLLLTRGARQLLYWFIGLGVVLLAATIVSDVLSGTKVDNALTAKHAITTLHIASTTLTGAETSYANTVQGCQNAVCAETADGQIGTAFASFASTVHGTPVPGSAASAANTLYVDANKVAQDFTQLSHLSSTTTPAQYESKATSLGLAQDATKLQGDYSALTTALKSVH